MAEVRTVEINSPLPPTTIPVAPIFNIVEIDAAVALTPAQDIRTFNVVSFNISTFN